MYSFAEFVGNTIGIVGVTFILLVAREVAGFEVAVLLGVASLQAAIVSKK